MPGCVLDFGWGEDDFQFVIGEAIFYRNFLVEKFSFYVYVSATVEISHFVYVYYFLNSYLDVRIVIFENMASLISVFFGESSLATRQ